MAFSYDTLVEGDLFQLDSAQSGCDEDKDDSQNDDDDECEEAGVATKLLHTVAEALDLAEEMRLRDRAAIQSRRTKADESRSKRRGRRSRMLDEAVSENKPAIGVYDHRHSLVAVRRLRVITVMTETSPKIPRLLQSSHAATVALLLIRIALKDEMKAGNFLRTQDSFLSESKIPFEDASMPGVGRIVSWAVAMVCSVAEIMRSNAIESAKKSGNEVRNKLMGVLH